MNHPHRDVRVTPLCTGVWAVPGHPQALKRARQLSSTLGLPVIERLGGDEQKLVLECTPQGLALRDLRIPRLKPISVKFDCRALNTPRKGPMARAIGRPVGMVVDATAGFGDDAWRMVCMGFHVIAVERSPLIGVLLQDGLQRLGCWSAIGERFQVVVGDARNLLLTMLMRPELVYIDTMFPPKRKRSALAKRKLRLLRDIVGDDEDVELLFAAAARAAKRRVVVKRPPHAPPLAGGRVATHGGKLARYDVYCAGSDAKRATL